MVFWGSSGVRGGENIVLESNKKLQNIAAAHAQSGEKNLSLTTNLEAKVHMFDLRSD